MKPYWILAAGIGAFALALNFIVLSGPESTRAATLPAGLGLIFLSLLASCTAAAIREMDRRLRAIEKAAGEPVAETGR